MDKTELEEKFKIAKEIVSKEEEPFKTEGFKILLDFLLSSDGSTKRKSKDNKQRKSGKKGKKISKHKKEELVIEIKNDINDLASKCNISKEKFSETISIKNEIVEILKKIQGSNAFKQLIFSQCILATYRILCEVEWVPVSFLRKSLEMSGVGSISNLAPNLSGHSNLIVDRGAFFGTEYKVTGEGLHSAYKIIEKLTKGEKLDESKNLNN